MQSQVFDTLLISNQAKTVSTNLLHPEEVVMPQLSTNDESQQLESRKQIILMIQDTPLRLVLIQNTTLLLGRSNPNTKLYPDIDLTLYGGAEYGVSRTHCTLLYKNHTLSVRDLGSSNGTYINGRRLQPNRTEELTIGDILLLGQLKIQLTLPKVER